MDFEPYFIMKYYNEKVPTTKTKSQTPKQIKTFYKLESTFPSFITSLRHDYTKNLTQQKKTNV